MIIQQERGFFKLSLNITSSEKQYVISMEDILVLLLQELFSTLETQKIMLSLSR